MLKYLEEIIELGEDLKERHQLEFYENHVEDIFLDIVTKSELFFSRLTDDPLNLKIEFGKSKKEYFNISSLEQTLRILKKAKNYFDKIEDESPLVWEYIHPHIKQISKRKFENGFYADAVETALKEINNFLKIAYKNISGEELDGAKLMQKIFSVQNPVFQFADITDETGRNIQQGYMNIFAGAMIGIRNPKAHNNLTTDKYKAIHLLQIASFMMVKIDELGILKSTSIKK